MADANYEVAFNIYTNVVSDSLLIIRPVNWKQVQLLHYVCIEIAGRN